MREGVDCHGKAWIKYSFPYDKKYDLTNQKFGELTALFRVTVDTNSRTAYWLCQCSCGNKAVVLSSYLRSGHTTSCGCMSYEKMASTHRKLLKIGEKFDRWTVLSILPMESGNKFGTKYMCQCDRGTVRAVNRQGLVKGISTSCGCKRTETTRELFTIDLTNKKFGLLTALELVEKPETSRNKSGGNYWRCKCDCGQEIITRAHQLLQGNTCSCGCIKQSYGEHSIIDVLEKNHIHYKKEYTFSDLLGIGGGHLRYDFAFLDDNNQVIRLVEFDGPQHYKISSGFFKSEEKFEKIQKHDNLKNQYALSHNIPLVRIPYKERDNITLDLIMGDKYLFIGNA